MKQFYLAVEGGEVCPDTLGSWAEQFPEIIKGYKLKNILNADEIGLFW